MGADAAMKMSLPAALLLSAVVTLILSVILYFIVGMFAFALFLFLPLGFFMARTPRDKANHKPIEPK
jgi:hypothetical protein